MISIEAKTADKVNAELLVIPVSAPARKPQKAGAKKSKKQSVSFASFSSSSQQELKSLPKDVQAVLLGRIKQFSFSPEGSKPLEAVLIGKKPSSTNSMICISPLQVEPKTRNTAFSLIDSWRKLGAEAFLAAKKHKVSTVAVSLHQAPKDMLEDVLQAVSEGVLLAGYEFSSYRSRQSGKPFTPKKVALLVPKTNKASSLRLKRAEINARATSFARDLVNCPPSDLPPRKLVDAARKIARSDSRIKLSVLDEKKLKKLGANGILGVSRGSAEKPYLIHLTYQPKKKSKGARRIALIGKGVTFDSGGLSIKPAQGMEEMKCDMAGAAAVLGVMQALSARKGGDEVRHVVHVFVPTVENMVNGKSMKPGDVLRTMSGKTVEVLNTDAEGRLILADALHYAARVKPEVVIDIATLTGACVVALGNDYAGLFSNDERLSQNIVKEGLKAGEQFWPLPLAAEYELLIRSPVADIKNIGRPGPGAITAALFLKEFVEESWAWAHLDIAGPAFVTSAGSYTPQGGTGVGVRTLVGMLESGF